MEDEMESSSIEITDENRYEMYYGIGLPKRIHIHRQTVVDVGAAQTTGSKELIIELVQ